MKAKYPVIFHTIPTELCRNAITQLDNNSKESLYNSLCYLYIFSIFSSTPFCFSYHLVILGYHDTILFSFVDDYVFEMQYRNNGACLRCNIKIIMFEIQSIFTQWNKKPKQDQFALYRCTCLMSRLKMVGCCSYACWCYLSLSYLILVDGPSK